MKKYLYNIKYQYGKNNASYISDKKGLEGIEDVLEKFKADTKRLGEKWSGEGNAPLNRVEGVISIGFEGEVNE